MPHSSFNEELPARVALAGARHVGKLLGRRESSKNRNAASSTGPSMLSAAK
jgi:hypothetical protein